MENCANRSRQMKNWPNSAKKMRMCKREREVKERNKWKKPHFFWLVCFSSSGARDPFSPSLSFTLWSVKLKLQRAKRKPQMEEMDEKKELLAKYKKKSDGEKQERGKVGKRKLT